MYIVSQRSKINFRKIYEGIIIISDIHIEKFSFHFQMIC